MIVSKHALDKMWLINFQKLLHPFPLFFLTTELNIFYLEILYAILILILCLKAPAHNKIMHIV